MNFLEKYRLFISLGMALILIAFILLVWNYDQKQLDDSLSSKVSDTGDLIVQQFDIVIRENVSRLENLKHRLEISEGDYFQYWDSDAQRIVETEPSFRFIEWIDSTMIIQRVEPIEGNEEAIGLDISSLDYRNSDWQKAKADSVFNMTHWLGLVQGDFAFLVDEPIYINAQFQGTLTAGMEFTSRFDEIMGGLDEYHLRIKDDIGTNFYSFGSPIGTDTYEEMKITRTIQLLDANQSVWTVTMVPNYLFGEVNSISDDKIILGLIILLSLLVAVSYFLSNKSIAAERTSNVANRKLRALIEAAPVGVYVINANGFVTDFWNPAAEKMLGWKQEEVVGNFLPHVTNEYKANYHDLMKEIKESNGISNREICRKRKDGTSRLFRVNISKIIGDEEQMLVIFEDITKEKEYELKLEKSIEEKNILLAEIHHRVKNNLAIIVGLIELQNIEVEDQNTKAHLYETKNRIYSISGVHELLYQTENFSDIDILDYMNELVNRLHQTYQDENNPVTIEKNISDFSINITQAVPLGLLFNELITNSYKHAFTDEKNPKITLELSQNKNFIEILYEDNGKGLDINIFDNASSLGVTVIKSSLAQLNAEYEIHAESGFEIRFRFPFKENRSDLGI